MKFISYFTLFFAILTETVAGQTRIPPNEQPVITFKTAEGMQAILTKDTNDAYLFFRWFNQDTLLFEYPCKDSSAWRKFTYTYFFRPWDGQGNGLDLNFLDFTEQGYKYILYDIDYEPEKHRRIGMKKIALDSDKVEDFKAINKTRKGDLSDFRYSELIEIHIGQLFE